MVPRIQFASFGLIFAGLITLFFAYYHAAYLQAEELTLATFLARLLATINPAEEPAQLAMVDGFYLTENRAVLFWFYVAATLPVAALLISTVHRIKHGATRLFIPICFAATATIGCILKVAYDIRVLFST